MAPILDENWFTYPSQLLSCWARADVEQYTQFTDI